MFITIYFYDTQTRELIVSNPSDAHSVLCSLDKDDNIRQWYFSEEACDFPWSKETLWKKCKHFVDWDYRG